MWLFVKCDSNSESYYSIIILKKLTPKIIIIVHAVSVHLGFSFDKYILISLKALMLL